MPGKPFRHLQPSPTSMATTCSTSSGSSFLPWPFPLPGHPPLCPRSSKDRRSSATKTKRCWGVLKQADVVGRQALEGAGRSWVGLCTVQVCHLGKLKGLAFWILWQGVKVQKSWQTVYRNAGNTFKFSLTLLSHLWL